MFLKTANSDTENGINFFLNVTWKVFLYSGNWKTGKMKNKMYQNNTVIGGLPNLNKIFLYIFFISKRPASFSKQF